MEGSLTPRSTINQDHRLVGVGTRLTLLPLPRFANGYLTHQLKTVLEYIPFRAFSIHYGERERKDSERK